MATPTDVQLIKKYTGSGVLLDSNLLLLLLIGTHDRALVARYKRLAMFAQEDYDTLRALVARFRYLFITPNTATEVSNLAGGLSGDTKRSCFRTFAQMIEAANEILVPSIEATSQEAFVDLGLTDAALFRVAGDPPLILTVDFELSQRLTAEGLPVVNFNHIRYAYWN